MSKDVDAVAKVVIQHKGSILMLLKDTNEWELPGGHLQQGEKYTQGAKREVFEETSIVIKRLYKLCKQKDFMLFLATPKICKVILSDEHIHYGWFKREQLKKLKVTKSTKLNWKKIISTI